MVTTEIILFAIRSGLHLSLEARKHYVASTQARSLTFPLPNVNLQPQPEDAIVFFRGSGSQYIAESAFLSSLKAGINSSKPDFQVVQTLTAVQRVQLLDTYDVFFSRRLAEDGSDVATDIGIDDASFIGMLQIQQWQKGDSPHPTLVQRVAGTLVELSVDYFSQIPGAINPNSQYSKALEALLGSLDEIDFSEAHPKDLPAKLLTATLETVADHSTLVTSDPKFQQLIATSAKALSTDAADHIQRIRDATGGGNLDQERRVTAWAEMVFRSLLRSGGKTVISNPKLYLQINDPGQQDLASTVGGALLDAIIQQPEGELDKVFSLDSLEKLVSASLQVISRHPSLLVHDNKRALIAVVKQATAELGSKTVLFGPEFLPETLRIVLDKTGENLELFWPDRTDNPQKNLLLIATKQTIDVVSSQPADNATWRPVFSRSDVDDLLATVLDHIVANPSWVINKAGEIGEHLKISLSGMLDALRKMDDRRISASDGKELIKAGVNAVVMNPSLAISLQGRTVPVAAVIDAVAGIISREANDNGSRLLVRRELLLLLTRTAMDKLAEEGVTLERINTLVQEVKSIVAEVNTLSHISGESLALRVGNAISAA